MDETVGAPERLEVQRTIPASPAEVFRVLCDPQGHVAIDASGMLMDAEGDPVTVSRDERVLSAYLGEVPA